jgi:hypothetical protein
MGRKRLGLMVGRQRTALTHPLPDIYATHFSRVRIRHPLYLHILTFRTDLPVYTDRLSNGWRRLPLFGVHSI